MPYNKSEKTDYRELLKQEYIKCANDPAYFCRKYVYIQHPMRGRILFNLYPFQEKVLHLFRDSKNIIVLKSRQLGISTLGAGYALWLMLFHKDKNILCLATTQATARNLVKKVIFAYEQLPKWLQVPTEYKNKLSMGLKNGSKVEAKSSNSDAARSEAVSLLLIDEAAFIDNIEATFAAAQQTLATGGQAMLLSTPNGMGNNFFYKTWVKAELGENSFVPVKLPWQVHPERDQAWRDKQDADLGPRFAGQECDCDFLTSGDTIFEFSDLEFYETTYMQDPVERRGVDSNFWIWERPDYSRSYLLSADVARGDGTDYSAFHVWDVETCTQVAEYKGKMTPKDYGAFLVAAATEYNNALLVCENANIGWATIEEILSRNYQNLYYSMSGINETADSYAAKMDKGRLVPGFTTSTRTRPLVVAKIYDYIHERSCVVRSKRLLTEMRNFVWKNGKAQAQEGMNDDVVMSAAIGLYVRDTALQLRQQGLDLSRAQLNTFGSLNQKKPVIYQPASFQNPYEMKDNFGHSQDISWVLR